MPKVVKKKRRGEISKLMSAEAQKKAERKIKKLVDEMDDRADERYELAMKILEASPEVTHEAVERMADTMRSMAGEPRLKVDGIFVNYDSEILERINRKLHIWMAVRLLVACAKWEVRIADFTPPKKMCATCGKKA